MEIGVRIPHVGPQATPDFVRAWCQTADPGFHAGQVQQVQPGFLSIINASDPKIGRWQAAASLKLARETLNAMWSTEPTSRGAGRPASCLVSFVNTVRSRPSPGSK